LTREEIQEYFEQFGEVHEVRLIVDKAQNAPRGFGFVLFKERKGAIMVFNNGDIHTIKGIEVYRTHNKRSNADPRFSEKSSSQSQETTQLVEVGAPISLVILVWGRLLCL